jgi:hypothetical protein
MYVYRRLYNICAAVFVAAAIASFQLPLYGQDAETLRQRIKQLETENDQLRKTSELQIQELLELRKKLKQLEASLPDSADSNMSQVLPESRTWSYAAGLMVLQIVNAGDALSRTIDTYDINGTMVGYSFSAGKDCDRLGLTVYQGKYAFDTTASSSPKTWASTRTENERVDIDFAWTRLTVRNDRTGFGVLLGAKYLRSDKTISCIEVKHSVADALSADGFNEWIMANIGIFVSSKLFGDYPLSVFAAGSASIGVVRGLTHDFIDETWNDGKVDSIYRDGAHAAWGLNGLAGLQHPLTRHGMIRVGYRGQALNSTDGFAPFLGRTRFYDGHQGVFVALDYLF